MHDFAEYKKLGEPNKIEKSEIWETAIGLQQVDGLKPSDYLIETAKQNIEGKLSIYEVKEHLNKYYKSNPARAEQTRTEEADKVSARIAEILGEKTFSFSPAEYLNLHQRLFSGIYKFAGKIRDYNITKSACVLNGETVLYASALNLRKTLEYDFKAEKSFNYKGLSKQQIIKHLARFVAYLWQIHIFGEGNTRTTAVFLIKYLRKLGFTDINNDLFTEHSWYFRNALVRANYEDLTRGIYKSDKYLIRFLANLLLKEKNILKNRELHINFTDTVNASVSAGVNAGVKLTKIQKKILLHIAKNTSVSQAKLARKLKVNESTIYRNIEKLKQANFLGRTGSDKTGHWTILLIKGSKK
jgi:fido (protein-threonine AMPylation protein)